MYSYAATEFIYIYINIIYIYTHSYILLYSYSVYIANNGVNHNYVLTVVEVIFGFGND